jgi:signal transduction histidine kinase
MPTSPYLGALDQEPGVGRDIPRLLVLDEVSRSPGSAPPPGISSLLKARGYQVVEAGDDREALQRLRDDAPELLIVGTVTSGDGAGLRKTARDLGIPVLNVADPRRDLTAQLESLDGADDWVVRGVAPEELAVRVARLLVRPTAARGTESAGSSLGRIDTRLSALIVHDLRSPLNVIKLSLRMIEPVLPPNVPDVQEDLRFIDENFRQLERMLSQLGDYARLFEPGFPLSVSLFSPRRLVEEMLESRAAQRNGNSAPVRLKVDATCPAEAELDLERVWQAIDYVLTNASAAAGEAPIQLTLRGRPGRWVIEVGVALPFPSSVHSVALHPQEFERLCGTAAERRGMDLAIAARISEVFGGTARLEAIEGRGTTVILDWPTQIARETARS